MRTLLQKNDSEKGFYKLRDINFEALSEKAIWFFQENVKQISVTLDKVTGKQYDRRLFIWIIELPVQHMKATSAEHGQNMARTCSVKNA